MTREKASVDLNNLTQADRESISGAGVPKTVVGFPVVAPVPTFTFDVFCEDGIKLYVDLNSTPSDWIESLKAGVQINDVVHKPKSQSNPKHKKGSFTLDPSKESDNGQLQDGSYPTSILTDNLAKTDQPDEGKGSLSSPGLKSLNSVHCLGNLIDEEGYLTSRIESGTKGKLSGAKSSRRAANSHVNAAVRTRNHFNFTRNSATSYPKCSEMPARQGSNAVNGICENPTLQQTYCSLEPAVKRSELLTTVCMETKASTFATVNQDIEYSPSGIGRCVNVDDRLKNNEVVLSRKVNSIQAPSGDELQMWPVQSVAQSTCVSPVLNSLPLDLVDRSEVETRHRRTSFFKKSDLQIREAQSHSAANHSKGRYESQNVIDLTEGIETEKAGFLRTQEAVIETDELQQKDAAIYPWCNDGSLELVVPRQNGLDHCISTKSNKLQEDICRSSDTANVGNLGKSDTGNGREGSECLNFDNLTEKSWKKTSDPESSREHRRMRNFNSVEHHQSKFVNTEANILMSSKQFPGGSHPKRKRSSRFYTKRVVADTN
ncbi:uncharacterized protein [Spinacia oleracea]|uniref:Uncharacterized protein isoform X2 n=1 Tax=Spinacia oleracea TaxID=3562 RepID=A0A9R0IZR8_SPIOL|nr:uncharacterized protein LOC110797791 isoform X2 [Spinacia oleracea]